MPKRKLTNNLQLREELCGVFDKLLSGEMEPKDAKEVINAAGKIIGTVKLELQYADLLGTKPNIAFLNQ